MPLRNNVLAAALVVATAALLVGAGRVSYAQTNWTPSRGADGRPDLQGVWLSNIATPLQRPSQLAGRDYLTPEEVATLRTRARRIFQNGRSAFATPEGAFFAALNDVETYEAESTASSIAMEDVEITNRTSQIVHPADGRIPGLTAAGRMRQDAVDTGWRFKTGPEDLNSFHRCVTTGVPRVGGNFGAGPYSFYQLVQTPQYVVFMSEAFHDARIIPLDGRPHLPDSVRQWNGDSRGYWEGDTLVVETRNFSLNSYFRGSAEGLHLVERFTRIDPETLTYELTFTDPTTWVSPWTAEIPLKRRSGPLYEFACHEGNYSLLGMLRTARLEETK